MTNESERAAFEQWYVENAFDFCKDQIGSRDCSLQWNAWQASRAQLISEPVEWRICELRHVILKPNTAYIFTIVPNCESCRAVAQSGDYSKPKPWPVVAEQEKAEAFDFVAHLARQAQWSENTFGPGSRAAGVVDHIRKELIEIEADPGDLKEWIDVVILALDGAWRSGAKPQEIIEAIVAKQTRNEGRNWPDWRTADPNKAIEHIRVKCDAWICNKGIVALPYDNEGICSKCDGTGYLSETKPAPSTDQVEQEKAEPYCWVDVIGEFTESKHNSDDLPLYLHSAPSTDRVANEERLEYAFALDDEVLSAIAMLEAMSQPDGGSITKPGAAEIARTIRRITATTMAAPESSSDEVQPISSASARVAAQGDSETLTQVIAEMRAREAVGRAKYGTDVDRTDLTNSQWRQHLSEELMDALLYLKTEERTAQDRVAAHGGDELARDAARYRWLKSQKSANEILAYIVLTKDVDQAIDAALRSTPANGEKT